MKKQENVKHRQGNSRSIETDQQMTQMTELADKCQNNYSKYVKEVTGEDVYSE